MNAMWNIWHGCHKKSEGCKNCYIFRGDERKGVDFNNVVLSAALDQPLKLKKDGTFHYPTGSTFNMCFSSDFLIEEADEWRQKVWESIKARSDCKFFFLTKRNERFLDITPSDWGNGYDNVAVGVSAENQEQVDFRIGLLAKLPIKHRYIALCPLLEEVSIAKYLDSTIEGVTVGGESGQDTRVLNYEWVQKVREECIAKNIDFSFRQTGSRLLKDGILQKINYFQESNKAKEFNMNYTKKY